MGVFEYHFTRSFFFLKISSPQANQSPLALACANNNLDIAELLLQNGAHPIVQVCWFF